MTDETILIHCDMCGKPTDKWAVRPDCDRSVGYHGSVEICPDCDETYYNTCPSCKDRS